MLCTALFEATDSWAYNIDQGNVNTVVIFDLKNTFDTVDHNILLSKVMKYGVHGTSENFLAFWIFQLSLAQVTLVVI